MAQECDPCPFTEIIAEESRGVHRGRRRVHCAAGSRGRRRHSSDHYRITALPGRPHRDGAPEHREAKEQFYYERTVFLRCVANSNPPVRYSWRRGREVLSQGSDKGVEIYEPFFTQGETKILKLKNLRPQDYANYSCIASVRNVCGIPDKNVLFRLTNKTASPTIKLLGDDPVVVNPGQTVTLVCIASDREPTPTLTWVRSADSLPGKSVLNGGTLTLPAITSDDAGLYSCVANNNVGNPAKKSTTVVVRGTRQRPDTRHYV
ncbi:hypothetical protein AAFF_G00048660 [Aldrovandia affinis]|uniref:Ig-like domain-containing protein n=1 Tax=Aldrovandia affinis TaxID=143900 RepID=A0AAD7S1M8_9TELE|nr:hypothetical protein AAFF_G00048660 [Aldrovandia affinis]